MFHIRAINLIRPFTITKCIIHRSFSSQFPTGSQSTIYALATGGIRCALGVIRVSGPNTTQVLQKVGRFSSEKKLPEPRKATLKKLYDPMSDKVIDHGILLWFPGPKSFTGEDSCEFHVHGGPAVITTLLRAIGNVDGCRMAEPGQDTRKRFSSNFQSFIMGTTTAFQLVVAFLCVSQGEFSKRAFLNGKMDLTEVEGLGDLISAETEMQRAQALNQMSGSLGSLYESWRDRIAKCLANAEAFIDFGEDENIENDILEKVEIEIESLVEKMTNHLKDQRKGERLRNGVRIAILGKPNVGKSSLLNILSKRDVAIVSSIPGTTRDIVESCIDLHGYPVVFADTAGIRASPDEIEKEGIRRAVKEAQMADIVLLVISYMDISKKSAAQHHDDKTQLVRETLAKLLEDKTGAFETKEFLEKVLLVANKIDLATGDGDEMDVVRMLKLRTVFDAWISCKTLQGLENLAELLASKVATLCTDPKFESPCLTRERYRSHLNNCVQCLKLYLNPDNPQDLALRTHSLKVAMNHIGFITGHLGTEDILDIIFTSFCIGK